MPGPAPGQGQACFWSGNRPKVTRGLMTTAGAVQEWVSFRGGGRDKIGTQCSRGSRTFPASVIVCTSRYLSSTTWYTTYHLWRSTTPAYLLHLHVGRHFTCWLPAIIGLSTRFPRDLFNGDLNLRRSGETEDEEEEGEAEASVPRCSCCPREEAGRLRAFAARLPPRAARGGLPNPLPNVPLHPTPPCPPSQSVSWRNQWSGYRGR